jgi:pimeloyl-ACP methyl ester carboxylesterase
MSSIVVPEHRPPQNAAALRIFYAAHGCGPRLVVLVPGLLTPGSMYTKLAAHLTSPENSPYTVLAVDNRGSGASGAPLAHPRAYSPDALARDAWAVVDAVRRERGRRYDPEVGLVGHSMGGMVVQRMVVLRPRAVRFCALLGTHAGGLWNLVPTLGVFLAGLRVALNGFDAGAVAMANLDMHFTPPFLEQHVSRDPYAHGERQQWGRRGSLADLATEGRRRVGEAMATEGVLERRKRRDVYFARYMGRDFEWATKADMVHTTGEAEGGEEREAFSSAPAAAAALGHLLVVVQHRLRAVEQRAFRRCLRLRTLVLAGVEDKVVAPLSSRALAHGVGAVAYVELPGAHFFFDERAAHVNALVALGLRSAFRNGSREHDGAEVDDEAFGGREGHDCACAWCMQGGEEGREKFGGDGESWVAKLCYCVADTLMNGFGFRQRDHAS